jgi:hypothetical protein
MHPNFLKMFAEVDTFTELHFPPFFSLLFVVWYEENMSTHGRENNREEERNSGEILGQISGQAKRLSCNEKT